MTEATTKAPADDGRGLTEGLGPIARVVPYLYTPTVRLEWASTEAAHNARPGPLYGQAVLDEKDAEIERLRALLVEAANCVNCFASGVGMDDFIRPAAVDLYQRCWAAVASGLGPNVAIERGPTA